MLQSLIPLIQTVLAINIALISFDIIKYLASQLSFSNNDLIDQINDIITENKTFCNRNSEITMDKIDPDLVKNFYVNSEDFVTEISEQTSNRRLFIEGLCFCFCVLLIDGIFENKIYNEFFIINDSLILYFVLIFGSIIILVISFYKKISAQKTLYCYLGIMVINIIINFGLFLWPINFDQNNNINLFFMVAMKMLIMLIIIFPILKTVKDMINFIKEKSKPIEEILTKCKTVYELNESKFNSFKESQRIDENSKITMNKLYQMCQISSDKNKLNSDDKTSLQYSQICSYCRGKFKSNDPGITLCDSCNDQMTKEWEEYHE